MNATLAIELSVLNSWTEQIAAGSVQSVVVVGCGVGRGH